MSFFSLEFAGLLVLAFLLFWHSGEKGKRVVLLGASLLFIGWHHPFFLIAALTVSLFTYLAGRLTERAGNRSGTVLAASVSGLILCWTGFRYGAALTGNTAFPVPLGISFYTFQAIAYLTEIHWKEQRAERNLPVFLIYMLLFQKFLSGPIERPGDLIPQLRNPLRTTYRDLSYGMKLIGLGLMKKLLLADQIAPYTDRIFASAQTASGLQLLTASLIYPLELYADFSGYTDLALGLGLLFGLKLSPNFNRPLLADTTAEFWRRWHMSLSFWVRDYVYLPLTAVTRSWGTIGIPCCLLATFTLLGIWHGTGANFAVYGLIQGIVIVWEMKTVRARQRFRGAAGDTLYLLLARIRTYLIFAFSLIFFKAGSLADAGLILSRLSFRPLDSWKEMNLGMSDHTCIVAGAAVLLLLVYEAAGADPLRRMEKLPAAVRWAIYLLTFLILFIYGNFCSENFIYLQF